MKLKNISKFLIFLFTFTLIIFTSACGDENGDLIELTGTRDLEMTVGTVMPDLTEGISVAGFTFDDLDSILDVDISNVNTNLVGEYEITYTLTDPSGLEYTASIILSVIDGAVGNAPYIFGVTDITYIIGENLPNLLEGVTASDSKFGNLTYIIDVDANDVDFDNVGTYEVIYHVQNEDGYHYTTTAEVEVIWGDTFLDLPEPFVIAKLNNLYGIIDLEGTVIVPLEYSSIQYNGDDMLRLEKGGETFFYNFDIHEFIQYEYTTVGYFHDGLATAKDEFNNWGYINIAGEAVIPFIYDFTYNFYNGFAEVKMGNNYGMIDTNGNVTIDIMYSNIYGLVNGYYGEIGRASCRERV